MPIDAVANVSVVGGAGSPRGTKLLCTEPRTTCMRTAFGSATSTVPSGSAATGAAVPAPSSPLSAMPATLRNADRHRRPRRSLRVAEVQPRRQRAAAERQPAVPPGDPSAGRRVMGRECAALRLAEQDSRLADRAGRPGVVEDDREPRAVRAEREVDRARFGRTGNRAPLPGLPAVVRPLDRDAVGLADG